MLCDDWIRIVRQPLQCRHKIRVAAIPHGSHRISTQSQKLGTPHRRSAKLLPKFLRLHLGQPFEPWIHQAFSRLKLLRRRDRSLAIPRADILTNIAAENVPPHSRPQLFRNRAALLNREIRNAQARIKFSRRNNRLRRTGGYATRARAAAIRSRQVSRKFRRNFQRREDYSEKQPRAQLLVDDAGVLPDPSDARILGIHAFDKRAGVDIRTKFNSLVSSLVSSLISPLLGGAALQRCDRAFFFRGGFSRWGSTLEVHELRDTPLDHPQPPHDGIVIILAAPRVARNPARASAVGCINLRRVRLRGVVVDRAHDHAARPGRSICQIRSLQFPSFVARLHVLHLAMSSIRNPRRKNLQLAKVADRRDSAEFKARLGSNFFDEGRKLSRPGRTHPLPGIHPANLRFRNHVHRRMKASKTRNLAVFRALHLPEKANTFAL